MSAGLIDRAVVRRLRTAARTAVAADPRLRAERRRHRRPRTYQDGMWTLLRLALSALFGVLAAKTFGFAEALHVFSLAALAMACLRATQIQNRCSDAASLFTFVHLPVADAAACSHLLRPVARALWGIVLDAAVIAGVAVAALSPPAGVTAWLALPLWALAHGLVCAALALGLVLALPRFPFGVMAWVGGLGVFLALRGFLDPAPGIRAAMQPVLDVVGWSTPAGWLQRALVEALAGQWLAWLVPIAAIGCAAALARWALFRLHAGFALPMLDAIDPFLPDEGTTAVHEAGHGATVARAVAALPAPGQTLRARGRIGATAASLLSPRHLVVADLLQPAGLHWDRAWCWGVGLLLAACALRALGLGAGVVGAAAGLGLLLSVPLLGGGWLGLGLDSAAEPVAPPAYHPVRVGDLVRVILTVNVVRLLAALPLALVAVPLVDRAGMLPWPTSAIVAAKIVWVLLAWQPICLVMTVSQISRRGAPIMAGAVFAALVISVAAVVAIGLLIAFFLLESQALAALAGLGLLAFSAGMLAWICRSWAVGTWDLLKPTPRN